MSRHFRKQFEEIVDVPLSQTGQGKTFSENNIVRSLLLGETVLFLFAVGLLIFSLHPSEASFILHYNVYFGVDLLGSWWQLYILPMIALFFSLVNMFLARRFYQIKHERVAAYLLLLGSTMVLSGALLGCLSVVYINY